MGQRQTKTCYLCYEEKESVSLSNCDHSGCRDCLAGWMQKEESSGQSAPTCPFCRAVVADGDAEKILGRPFRPRGRNAGDLPGEAADDLTLQWLRENTKLCEGCGSRVEKAEGCDHIRCLCGWQFCYGCGSPGGACACTRRLSVEANTSYAPIRDAIGRVSVGNCIRRKQLRDRRQRMRMGQKSEEADLHSPQRAMINTSNGMWIFFSSGDQCVRVLAQQLAGRDIQDERGRRRSLTQSEQRHNNKISSPGLAAINTSNGRWLFEFARSKQSIAVLAKLLAGNEIRKIRAQRRQVYNCYNREGRRSIFSPLALADACDGSWLFSSSTKNGCIRVLGCQLAGTRVRALRLRKSKRAMLEAPQFASTNASNGTWLFRATKEQSVRILTDQITGETVSQRRAQSKSVRIDECKLANNVDLSWMIPLEHAGPDLVYTRAELRADRRGEIREKRKEELKRWRHSEKNASLCTANGRWLFSSCDVVGCVSMLARQLGAKRVREERRRERRGGRREEKLTWKCPAKYTDILTANGRWLFSGKGDAGSVQILTLQLPEWIALLTFQLDNNQKKKSGKVKVKQ